VEHVCVCKDLFLWEQVELICGQVAVDVFLSRFSVLMIELRPGLHAMLVQQQEQWEVVWVEVKTLKYGPHENGHHSRVKSDFHLKVAYRASFKGNF
jgi:hypothetical protein